MKDNIKAALETLRAHGVVVPRRLLSRASKEMPTIHHADLRKFRAYCEVAWKHKTRFVVGWGGAAGRAVHLTFHTMEGFEGRRKHASTIRSKMAEQRPEPAPTPKAKKQGTRVMDLRDAPVPSMPTE